MPEDRRRIAVWGHGRDGFEMRGGRIARRLGWERIDSAAPRFRGRYDVIVVVKYTRGCDAQIRAHCDRLVFDPLDDWRCRLDDLDPCQHWSEQFERLRFDDVLATSPSCLATMQEAVGGRANVHLLPHSCDRRVKRTVSSVEGPIVYAGALRYLGHKGRETLTQAASLLGRRLVLCEGPLCFEALSGAALVLHPRLRPQDTALNRYCKPQVKLENAAAAGQRVLATDDPCVTSLRPEVPVVGHGVFMNPSMLASAIDEAMHSEPLREPWTEDQSVERLLHILGDLPKAIRAPLGESREELRGER